MIKRSFAIMIILALTASAVLAQDKSTLTYRPVKGKSYNYTQDNLVEITQEMGGQEMKFNTDLHNILLYEIEDLGNDGNITMLRSFTQCKMHTKGMGHDTTIDMKEAIGKKSRVIMDQYGKLIRETALDTGKESKKMISMNLLGSSNFQRLPDHPVTVGDKWPRVSTDTSSSEDNQVIYKKNIEYSMTGKEKKGSHDCLKIEFKGTMDITGKMKQMGMDVVMEGNGETSGTLWFDPSTGMMIEENTTSTVEMTLALTGQSQMTVPMTQKVVTTQKLVE